MTTAEEFLHHILGAQDNINMKGDENEKLVFVWKINEMESTHITHREKLLLGKEMRLKLKIGKIK